MKQLFHGFLNKLDFILRAENVKYSFLTLFVIILISTAALSLNIFEETYRYNIGDIALTDVRVPRTIYFVKESETEIERKRTAESVQIVFDKDPDVLVENLAQVQGLFAGIKRTIRENPPIGTENLSTQLQSLKKSTPAARAYSDAVLLDLIGCKDIETLYKSVTRIIIYIYDNNDMGILSERFENPPDMPNRSIVIRTISGSSEIEEISRQVNQLRTIRDTVDRLHNISYSLAPDLSQQDLKTITKVIKTGLRPNLKYNPEETQRRVNDRLKNVKPVLGMLKKGQTIVREGDTITSEIMNKIDILNRNARSTHANYVFGIFLVQMVFFVIFGYFVMEYRQHLMPDSRATWIIFSLTLMFILYTFLIGTSEMLRDSKIIFSLLLPIPFVAMMLSILYNLHIAILVSVYLIFFTIIISGGDLATVILSFSSAVLGLIVNSKVDRRTDFLRGGLFLGVANALIVVSIALIEQIPYGSMGKNVQFALANGFINSILVLGLLPLYENVFGITTRFKLLELSDLNADIFKKMLVRAPGTYNHSLIVSTMAEAACKDIQANSMLARVGAFYHDIGKIEDAGMYIENKVTDPRANSLSAREYSQLIISHVSKGIELGRKFGLPESVIDFIREHHGKTTMAFFYHQALEEINDLRTNDEIRKSDFQYPGPKPHGKETAVVMLADAIEAASRTIQEPNAAKLEGLVRKIVYNKLNEGELEYSDLSMSELNRIQKSFLSILNGIFHTRIEYPDTEDVRSLEKKVGKGKSAGD